jgi:hypothetical protein
VCTVVSWQTLLDGLVLTRLNGGETNL